MTTSKSAGKAKIKMTTKSTTTPAQETSRPTIILWFRRSTKRPKRSSRPTVSHSTRSNSVLTTKIPWDARAFYFPGALPGNPGAVIYIDLQENEPFMMTTTKKTTTMTSPIHSSKTTVLTSLLESTTTESTSRPVNYSDFDVEVPAPRIDATINREIKFSVNSITEHPNYSTSNLAIGFSCLGFLFKCQLNVYFL